MNAVSRSSSDSSLNQISKLNSLASVVLGRHAVERRRQPAIASSSSAMVPVASSSPSVAPDGFDSVSVKVSSSSTAESSAVSTRTVCDVTFAGKLSVPDAAWESVSA